MVSTFLFFGLASVGASLLAVVVVGHLQAGASKAALDVKALVRLAAVQDSLVAADLFGDEVEGLDQAKTKLLALLVFGDGDIFDVTDEAKIMDAIYQQNRQLGRLLGVVCPGVVWSGVLFSTLAALTISSRREGCPCRLPSPCSCPR